MGEKCIILRRNLYDEPSLRLNTFTKIELHKWLNEPFTPPHDTEISASGFEFQRFLQLIESLQDDL